MKSKASIAILLLALILGSFVPAMATDAYEDMTGDEWYAEAVYVLRERGIMNGVGDNRFGAEQTFTRAQLVTVLYRMAGAPAVTGEDSFTDTAPGMWYSDAVLWSERNQIVGGYGDGRFGTNDPTTQEQLATMLWRDSGSYVVDSQEETGASEWAADAVRWLKAEDLLNKNGPVFAPKEPATRAQVADIVYRYLLLKEKYADVDAVSGATPKVEETGQTGTASGKILIAYFSRTGENYNIGVISEGNTAKFAREIAAQTGGDLFEIVPVTPYPSAYSEMLPIATQERSSDARPAIRDTVEHFADYDTVFIGYPIWWGDLPMILHTFMESYDFTGKTVIPFNTHEGSGQSGTQSTIANKLSGTTVLQGLAIRGSTAQSMTCDGTDATVKNWLDGLGLPKADSDEGSETKVYDFTVFSNVELIGADLSSMDADQLAVLWQQARYCQAMTEADIDTMREIVPEDTVFIHMTGVRQTREEYFADVASGALRYYSIGIENPVVEVNGITASIAYTSVLNANAYGARGTYRMAGTHWFELRDGEWMTVNAPGD